MSRSIRNSWELAVACFRILAKDKELLLYPLVLASILALFFLALAFSLFFNFNIFLFLLIFAILVGPILFTFLGIFFEAAVVGNASIRLQGGDPKFKDGLSVARKNASRLLRWSLIVLLVSIILGFISGMFKKGPAGPGSTVRVGGLPPMRVSSFAYNTRSYKHDAIGTGIGIPTGEIGIGDIISGVLGMAWHIATFFVIPVMLYEKLSPTKALVRSVEIIKKQWKESLILILSFKAIFWLLSGLGVIFILIGLILQNPAILQNPSAVELTLQNPPYALVAGIVAAIIYWFLLACLNFTFKGILRAVLYEFSRKGQTEVIQTPKAQEFSSLSNLISTFQKTIA